MGSFSGGRGVYMGAYHRNGGKFLIRIEPDEIIALLKLKIQFHEGIPPDQQRLFLGRKPLIVTRTLRSYNIVDRTEIKCTRVDGKGLGKVDLVFGGKL